MNKVELVEKVAAAADLTKKQADSAVNAIVGALTEVLENGDKITLKGFGTFEVRDRKARTARNPRTNEVIEVKASKVPAFKASSTLKKVVNK